MYICNVKLGGQLRQKVLEYSMSMSTLSDTLSLSHPDITYQLTGHKTSTLSLSFSLSLSLSLSRARAHAPVSYTHLTLPTT